MILDTMKVLLLLLIIHGYCLKGCQGDGFLGVGIQMGAINFAMAGTYVRSSGIAKPGPTWALAPIGPGISVTVTGRCK